MDNSAIAVIGPLISLLVVIGIYVWGSLALAAVFRKAGRETWPAWVPLYSMMQLCTLAGLPAWLGILTIIGPAAPFILLVAAMKISPRFGKSAGLAALAFFFPVIWLSILGWGSARWLGPQVDEAGWQGGATTTFNTVGGMPQHPGGPFAPQDPPVAGYDANGYPLSPAATVADDTALVGRAPAWLGDGLPQNLPGQPSEWPAAVAPVSDAGWPAPAAPTAPMSPAAAAGWPAPSAAERDPWATPPASSAFAAHDPHTPAAQGAHPIGNAAPGWGASADTSAFAPEASRARRAEQDASRFAPAGQEPVAQPPVAPAPSMADIDFFAPANVEAEVADVAETVVSVPSAEPIPFDEPDPWAPGAPAAPSVPIAVPSTIAHSESSFSASSLREAPAPEQPVIEQGPIIDSPFAPPVEPVSSAPSYTAAPVVPAAAPVSDSTPVTERASEQLAPVELPEEAPAPIVPIREAVVPEPVAPVAEVVLEDTSVRIEEPEAPAPVPEPAAVPGASVPGMRRGQTRMREDAEVVAGARAARPALPVNEIPAAPAFDDDLVPPIIVPGVSSPPPVPSDEAWQPRLRRERYEPDESTGVDDLSAEVSAVAGSPAAGQPRSAMTSVSAQQIPVEDDDFEATELASRRKPTWRLHLPMSSRPVDIQGTAVLLGRKPDDTDDEGVQLVPVADGTRTISKTHARIDLVNGVWQITDLGSTNGVVLIGEGGEETEIAAHTPTVLTERFLLGDAELRLTAQTTA